MIGGSQMRFFNTKKGLLTLGIIAGLGAALLAYLGNPKNMAFQMCIRDSSQTDDKGVNEKSLALFQWRKELKSGIII